MKNYIDQLFSHATTLHQQGDFKNAQASYKQILRDVKRHPDALHLLGLTYAQQGKLEDAVRYINQAIAVNGSVAMYHYNLGEAHSRMGQLEMALESYDRSLKIDPKSPQSHFGRANALKKMGDGSNAKAGYQKTIECNPNFFQAYYNWGNVEQDMGNYKSAMSCYEKCLTLNDNHALAHNNLGIMLQHWDRNDEAILHYKKAIQINPHFTNAHSNLAKLYETQGEIDQAKKYYQNLALISPDDVLVNFTLKTLSPVIFESSESIDRYHLEVHQALDECNQLSFQPDKISEANHNIFSDIIYQGRDVLSIKKKLAEKYIGFIPKTPTRKPNAVPHVGFVVTSGHEGVFVKCMKGMINQMDKARFKISVVCSLPNGKKIIEPALRKGEEVNFIELNTRLDFAAQQILDAQFDVLNYWEIGTDTTNYFLPFLRLAAVQTTSWGWPTTSGIPNVDYFISSKHLEIETADAHYSEQLIRLDHIPVYYYRPPVPDPPKSLEEYGLSDQNNLYFCAQNLKKVHPDFDGIVLGILEKDPKGLVLFVQDKQSNITELLRNRLARTCANYKDRIRFLPRMSEVDYLGLLSQVDVALDTLHYGGGANTCYDAFICGTPVISLPGQFHSSRYAYAAYQQMGLDYTVDSIKSYVLRAVEIAHDAVLRNSLSTELKEKSALLFEDQTAVDVFSDFVEQVTQKSKM